MADIKLDIVFEIFFLTISNVDIDFQAQDSQWRFYITRDVLLTTEKDELIGMKEFTIAVFDPEYKVFIIYIGTLNIDSSDKEHPLKRA